MKRIIHLCICVAAVAAPAAAQNHFDVVQQVAAEGAPARGSLEGALQFVLRVVDHINQQFPSEHVGVCEKTAGENIAPYGGTLVSASRVCYPNQHTFKVLSDVPTTNGPSWQDDGFIAVGGYQKGYLAVSLAVTPPVVIPPAVSPAPAYAEGVLVTKVDALAARVEQLYALEAEQTRADGEAHASIAQNVTDGRAENRNFIQSIGGHWKEIVAIVGPALAWYVRGRNAAAAAPAPAAGQ